MKRGLFDDDEEDQLDNDYSNQYNNYNSSSGNNYQQESQNYYQNDNNNNIVDVALDQNNYQEETPYQQQQDNQYNNYTPSYQQPTDYQGSTYNDSQAQSTPQRDEVVDYNAYSQNEEAKKNTYSVVDEYQQPQATKKQEDPVKFGSSAFAQERRQLFDDTPVVIDADADKDYPSYNADSSKVQNNTGSSQQVIVGSGTQYQYLQDLNKMKLIDVNLDEPIKDEIDPRVKQFSVTNPMKTGGHIKYTVTGVDMDGPFEEVRRFRDFFALKNGLTQRWPGIFIPALPEKKLVGNNDDRFVEERRNLLERFMKEFAKFDYLTHSKEFKIFARDKGDLDKILNNLVKQTPMQVLEKYRLNFVVEEDQPASSLQKYKENIIEFQNFLKKVIPVMEIQKKQIKRMISIRDAQDTSYKQIVSQLLKYEDNNVEYYTDSDITKRCLTNPGKGDFKEQSDSAFRNVKNPYRDAYYWVKGELLDIKGMNEALMGREQVVKMQSACEGKKRSDQSELEKLSQGKTTIKSIFKSKSSKENDILNLQASIEVANKDIEDYKKLINFLTIYHGQIAIQNFKKQKAVMYFKMLGQVGTKEISNSHSAATLWYTLIQNDQK